MTVKDALSLEEASTYLAMDLPALTALARARRIPSVEVDGTWVFSKKSIDKWRTIQARRA
ncbi:MAG: helix-turn-helix domain-containing protein [Candidatus Rokubacteria bacterium]|nr:helix-turn-helix domain-containing protein [Candidatus Rokubacteria bacterium]